MLNWILFGIVVILQILDAISTYRALKNPIIAERNKLITWIVDQIEIIPTLILTKGLFCIVLFMIVFHITSLWITGILGLVAMAYLIIVANNFGKD
jgi:hypothetical protein